MHRLHDRSHGGHDRIERRLTMEEDRSITIGEIAVVDDAEHGSCAAVGVAHCRTIVAQIGGWYRLCPLVERGIERNMGRVEIRMVARFLGIASALATFVVIGLRYMGLLNNDLMRIDLAIFLFLGLVSLATTRLLRSG
jgi:hypothetical protein